MNRELYIHTLRMLREQYEIARMDTVVETIDAALAEFERPTDNDCISRQAAIDTVRGWVNKALDDWGNAETEIRCFNAIYPLIMALPSAQPDKEALDDAYAHGYTYAESKYRAMMKGGKNENQSN